MELDESAQRDIYYGALLHDIGMAGQLASIPIENFHFNSDYINLHVDIGYNIVKLLPLENSNIISEYIKFHHEHWDGSGPYGLKGNNIPLGSQIIYLADRFDLGFDKHNLYYLEKDNQIIRFNILRNKTFSDKLIDQLFALFDRLDFWLDLQNPDLSGVLTIVEPKKTYTISLQQLVKIAHAFALVIDSKSPFTMKHSQGVGEIGELLGRGLGLTEEEIVKVKIACLLHDVGKLVVPVNIIDKPDKLTIDEFNYIKKHPYYTRYILSQVNDLTEIANWASNHHENLDGSGYPRGLNLHSLDTIDRIVAISDQFQALTEDRPYRRGLNYNEAFKILDNKAQSNQIDGKILNLLKKIV